MPAQPKLVPIYRFGPYTVDPSIEQLRKFDLKIKLAGHPIEILIMLLERPGQLVTREEIRQKLWGEQTFVDFENSLNKAVAKLRQALCDSADKPSYIETIPRRGYRFIGAVEGPAKLSDQAPLSTLPEKLAVTGTAISTPNRALPLESPENQSLSLLREKVKSVRGKIILAACFVILVGAGLALKFRSDASAPITSVAVLPLHYLSMDLSQEYLADGITDELTTQLAKLGGFRVTSRTSAMQFKKTNKSLPQIARELGVDALVEGSLERSGNRIRIHSQLIRARTDEHLWADTYDGDINELMDLEDRAAKDIAVKISRRLTPAQKTNFLHAHVVDPDAHIAYLQGRYFWNQRNADGFEKALRFFQKAIEKDPSYAAAYAGLADTYLLMGGYMFYSQNETIPKARAAAQKSLELEDSAEAHTSLGLIAVNYDWDWATGEREYRRAIELNPNYPTAHHWYGSGCLMLLGRFDEAMKELKRAQELDPLSPIIATDQGVTLLMARNYDSAIDQLQRTLELYPGYEEAQRWLSMAFELKGQYENALAALGPEKSSGESSLRKAIRAHIYANIGRRSDALRILKDLEYEASRRFVDPALIAFVNLALGRPGDAEEWYQKSVQYHSISLTSLKVNPLYDPMRKDPRFKELLHAVHLEQ